MTDPGLLAAVIAAPDDDVPRVVLADWWDEHGQPERAEFCRVQCELARITASPAFRKLAETIRPTLGRVTDEVVAHGIEQRDDVVALRRRERELLCGPAFDWFRIEGLATFADEVGGPFGGWLHKLSRQPATEIRVELARGFPSRLTLSWQDWQTHAAALLAACPIRRVNKPKECPACHGRPIVPGIYAGGERCASCHGTGKVDDWKGGGLVRLVDEPGLAYDAQHGRFFLTGFADYLVSEEPGLQRQDYLLALLDKVWGGVHFELPGQETRTGDIAERPTDGGRWREVRRRNGPSVWQRVGDSP